jgi:hypothetical protein
MECIESIGERWVSRCVTSDVMAESGRKVRVCLYKEDKGSADPTAEVWARRHAVGRTATSVLGGTRDGYGSTNDASLRTAQENMFVEAACLRVGHS